MKKLVMAVAMVMVMSVSAQAEDIVCKYMGGAYRPVSTLAKDISTELGIQSCQGARFKAVALQLNKKIIKKKATTKEKTDYLKALDVGADSFKGR